MKQHKFKCINCSHQNQLDCNFCHDPKFIYKKISSEKVFIYWFEELEMIKNKFLLGKDPNFSFLIIYHLFPIIESISNTLFEKSGRYYLKVLNISHPDLVYKIFRNGHLHNMRSNKLEYQNGTVGWGLSSSSSNIEPKYYPGYKNKKHPEDFISPDLVFEYKFFEDNHAHAFLSLDILWAQIKYDLEIRQKNIKEKKLKVIVGQKINERMPS